MFHSFRRPGRSRRALAASAIGATVALSGCGDSSGVGHDATVLGFVNGGGHTTFHICLQEAIELAARNEGVELATLNSQQDAGTELANIKDMTTLWKTDALILQPVDVNALQDSIAEAKSLKVPVFLTSVAPDNTSDILGAVVVDLEKAGAMDAGWIGKDAAGKEVQVGIIAGAPGSSSDLLVSGFTAALPDSAEIVSTQPGMFDPGKAERVAKGMIEEHPGLDYAFVANEEMALAARQAFDTAGAKRVRIVTVNGTDMGLDAIGTGEFSATVANSPTVSGTMAVKNTLALLAGKPTDKIGSVPLALITKDNQDTAPEYCP